MAAFFFLSYWFGSLAGSGTTLSTLGRNGWEAVWIAFRFFTTIVAIGSAFFFHLPVMKFVMILTAGWAVAYLIYFVANLFVLVQGAKSDGSLAIITK